MKSLTIFKHIRDNKTNKRMDFDSWEELESLLYKLSHEPGYKAKKGEISKRSSPLISPAIYGPDSLRRNVHVDAWAGWAALDVDSYEGSFEEIIESFGDHYFVCYSTASSTKEHPKFRLVFPLTKHVLKDDIQSFWHALNTEYLGLGDAQTKDLSRMYYVPAQYPDAYNFIFTKKGPFLDPDKLMEKHPKPKPQGKTLFERLPEHIQKEVLNHRRSKLTNTDVTWTSYRDCPFMNDTIVQEYKRITDSGWYHKMYQLMVSIAGTAIRKEYPITPHEIADLCRELDNETGKWYEGRPLEREAERAIEFVYRQGV